MSEVNFFVPKGPFYLNELCESKDKIKIFDIKTLDQASQKDITFFNWENLKIKGMLHQSL